MLVTGRPLIFATAFRTADVSAFMNENDRGFSASPIYVTAWKAPSKALGLTMNLRFERERALPERSFRAREVIYKAGVAGLVDHKLFLAFRAASPRCPTSLHHVGKFFPTGRAQLTATFAAAL